MPQQFARGALVCLIGESACIGIVGCQNPDGTYDILPEATEDQFLRYTHDRPTVKAIMSVPADQITICRTTFAFTHPNEGSAL
jgi:hypothetical protein